MNRMVTSASQLKGRKENRRKDTGRLRNGKNRNAGKASEREEEGEKGGVVVSDRVLVESKIRECDLQQAMVSCALLCFAVLCCPNHAVPP